MKKSLLKIFPILFVSTCLYAQDTITHERLYLGTGEYSPKDDWHGILRFDKSEDYNSEPGNTQYVPEGTIPIKQCEDNGVKLNFGHGIYLHNAKDRMYLATLFTNQNNIITTNSDTAVGSIAIFDNMSTLDGAQTPTRHIFGSNTGIKQPHGCWLDEKRDILYVANTFDSNILVFENASTADGNIAPDRIIDHDSLGAPVYIYIDTLIDRMFVCAMPMGGMPGFRPQVAIYNNASTLNGIVEPEIRISGEDTRLDLLNQTVHNCWFNPTKELLAVGHHTCELLFFDLKDVNWNPSTPTKYNLTPRILRVDDPALGYDSVDVNLYGLFWDLETDRMFCSVGIDNHNGGPATGSPPNAIKIFNNVSDSTLSGFVEPERQIYWSNGSTYFPPQPIWLQKYESVASGMKTEAFNNFKIYPNPFKSEFTIEASEALNEPINLEISNLLGQVIYKENIPAQGIYKKSISIGSKNEIYIIKLKSNDGTVVKKIIRTN